MYEAESLIAAHEQVAKDEQPKPAFISDEVLQDPSTHGAYMSIIDRSVLIVGTLSGAALIFMFVLAIMGRPIPEQLGGVPQWGTIILGVLLVGETLMGKVMVARNG